MTRVAVIGAGIVGLATGFALLDRGCTVDLYDADPEGDRCSHGNAGGIAVSEITPAAAIPSVLLRVPKWLVDPLGPLSLRPAHLPAMLPWLARFVASGRPAATAAIRSAAVALNRTAMRDLEALLDQLGRRGTLTRHGAITVYRTDTAFRSDAAEWRERALQGFPNDALSGDDARDLEPGLGPLVKHAVLDPSWALLDDPRALCEALKRALAERGAKVISGRVTSLRPAGFRLGDGTERAYPRIVVAAGAWSARLAAMLGERALLESERGYNITFPAVRGLVSREIIFGEDKFVASPLGAGLRVGGAAEFAGLDAPPRFARADRLARLARRYLPIDADAEGVRWMGQRPTTPDSLPVIGRSSRHRSIVYAFGHGHLGLTQAATTARLVADCVTGTPNGVDLQPYAISRFA